MAEKETGGTKAEGAAMASSAKRCGGGQVDAMAMFREIWRTWLRLTRYQQGIIIAASLLAFFDEYVKSLTAVAMGMAMIVAVVLAPWQDIISTIKSFELFGVGKVKFRRKLEKVTEDVKAAGLLQEPVAGQRDLPIYEQIYDDDPTLSLAGLRIDIAKRLRDLAKLAEIDIPPGQRVRRRLVKELQSRNILTADQADALSELIPLLDQASRSEEYDKEAADWAMKIGPKLVAGLAGLDERAVAAGGTRELQQD